MEPRKGQRNRFLSWLRFRMKKSAATIRTVPVDAAVPEIAERSDEDVLSSKLKKSKPARRGEKPKAQAADHIHNEIHVSGSTMDEKAKTSRSKAESGQSRLLLGKKMHTMRPGSSQPDSPKEKLPSSTRNVTLLHFVSHPLPKLNHQTRGKKSESQLHVASATAMTTPSVSFDDVDENRQQSAPKPSTKSAVKLSNPEQGKSSNKFDPMIGISVIMVTLAVMLLWGRLCAVLCTLALFYFGRYLRSAVRPDGGAEEETSDSSSSRVNAEKRKKEVVLEGFLERNSQSRIVNAGSGAGAAM